MHAWSGVVLYISRLVASVRSQLVAFAAAVPSPHERLSGGGGMGASGLGGGRARGLGTGCWVAAWAGGRRADGWAGTDYQLRAMPGRRRGCGSEGRGTAQQALRA